MFEEALQKRLYANGLAGHKQVRDYQRALELFNHLPATAPSWNNKEYSVGIVGTPFSAMLDWLMGTPSGFAFFLDSGANKILKKTLNAWAEFLSSSNFAYLLEDNSKGWLSKHGTKDLSITANVGQTDYTFDHTFKCDLSKKHKGYTSWDSFSIRTVQEDERPVASPDDGYVIANCCKSKPYKIARNIKACDTLCAKS